MDFVQCSIMCRIFTDETQRGSLTPRSLSAWVAQLRLMTLSPGEEHLAETVPFPRPAPSVPQPVVSSLLCPSSLALLTCLLGSIHGGRGQQSAEPSVICFVIWVKDRKVHTF